MVIQEKRGRRTENQGLLICTLIVLFLSLLAASASGEERIDPMRPQMLESLKQKQQAKAIYHQKAENANKQSNNYSYSYGYVNVTISGRLLPCETLTFSASISGLDDDSDVEYYWSISDENRDSRGVMFYPQYDDNKLIGMNTISYTFYSAGTYSVFVSASRNGSSLGHWYEEFTIPDDGVHPTLEQKAAQIVSANRGSTNWQTALNLYDWLTLNAYYDISYEHHGADLIFLGYGVCDSFSKAYLLLLQKAGITAERTFGPNHAWNTLKLGGKWYQADPTWDGGKSYQPGQGTAADGSEGHNYFCLSAAVMKQISSHAYADGTQDGEHCDQCTSMEANYFIHEEFWKGFRLYSSVSYYNQIQNAFNNGQTSFETRINNSFYYEDHNGNRQYGYLQLPILEGIFNWGLKNKADFSIGTDPIKIKAETINDGGVTIKASLAGWNIEETGTLSLPKEVRTIRTEAFVNNPATTLVIPKGCTTIEAGAFTNSKIRTVTIPASVVSIAENAFSGCGKIIVKTNNATAIEYAQRHGMLVVEP